MNKDSTKSTTIYRMPGKLWKLLKKGTCPRNQKFRTPGRPRVNNRDVIDGIWHVLWTGCQWKSIEKEWFNVSKQRFGTSVSKTWQSQGLFEILFKKMVKVLCQRVQNWLEMAICRQYDESIAIRWLKNWQEDSD